MEKIKAELKLEHLAPYFPYQLKFISVNGTIHEMTSISISRIGLTSMYGYEYFGKNVSKPILRPLSQLTHEIEHNGDRFVPMERLFGSRWTEWDGEFDTLKSMGNTYKASKGKVLPEFLESWILSNLHQWHFDSQGLIEKGLAIEKQN